MVQITSDSKFVIYGAGEVGRFCAIALKEKGYKVVGALDRQKKEGELVPEVPIVQFAHDVLMPYEKCEVIVLVCLADGMLHKEVADSLYYEGYHYLVFLPLRHSISQCKKKELIDLYNKCLIASEALEQNARVEDYENYYAPELNERNALLEETPETYTVFLNAEMLFSESMDLWKGDKSKVFIQDRYEDKNIMAQYQSENLWEYFQLEEDQCEDYFLAFKQEMTEEERDKVLKRREELYRLFQMEYNRGMDFFIHVAPSVVWNPKHYFNLVGGHHRTTFFLSKGHSFLPVRMKKEDFDKWYNRKAFEALKEYLYTNNISITYAPVPHPAMIEFPSECEKLGSTKLRGILRFLRWEKMDEMSVLEIGRSEGYYGRNMLRCGALSAEYRSEKEENLLLAEKVNQLLYVEGMHYVHAGVWDNNKKTYECVFVLDTFSGLSERENALDIMAQLERIGTKYLIWESDSSEDREYILTHTSFNKYYCIHKEYQRGKIWETDVYVKGEL